MRATRHGAYEYEVEAALQYVYRKHDSVAAYEPIVGAGHNACVLHYRANNAAMKDGDLLLVDAGAEFANYASDITRTWPVSGVYSKEQAALYELVLSAQKAALEKARPGKHWIAGHDAAVEVLTDGLLSLGLLKGTLKHSLASGDYKRFYMHKTGHWLGLDVHDVGEYKVAGEFRELEPGMVFTIEPGLYIAPEQQGRAGKVPGHRHSHRGRRADHQGRPPGADQRRSSRDRRRAIAVGDALRRGPAFIFSRRPIPACAAHGCASVAGGRMPGATQK